MDGQKDGHGQHRMSFHHTSNGGGIQRLMVSPKHGHTSKQRNFSIVNSETCAYHYDNKRSMLLKTKGISDKRCNSRICLHTCAVE